MRIKNNTIAAELYKMMKPKKDMRFACLGLFTILLVMSLVLTGCISEDVHDEGIVASYQKSQADEGPLKRQSIEGVGLLKQEPKPSLPELETKADPNTGKQIVNLSIEQALIRALSNNPEIRIVSFDPSITKEDITKAVAEFDPAAFGSYNYEKEDNPQDSIFLGGQSTSRLYEAGLKQKNTLGTEWSASYALIRNWDDLNTRILSSRFEPVAVLQLRQPLLRDGWDEFNKAGINIAGLNHRISLTAFRQVTEEVATRVVTAYWALLQAKRDVEIQDFLLNKTTETLDRVKDREGIDATTAQISQTETFMKLRESTLLEAKKRHADVQDVLVQLLSDSQINLLNDFEIIPSSSPRLDTIEYELAKLISEAMTSNPRIQQAKLGIEVAEINIKVAENQALPRLDLVASSRMQGLDRTYGSANHQLGNGDFVSWALGVNFEYPLGNRAGEAELRKRKLELSKSKTILYNTSDEVALETKERIRLLERAQKDLQIQKEAVRAAQSYLQGLEDLEEIRPTLTPEFLLVKLQAQESLAGAQRSEIKAITEFNSAIVQLAQATGTVLGLHRIQASLEEIVAD